MRHDGRSERQYFRFLRELHIADIGPQPPADAELDRNDDDIVALQIIGSEAADEIEFALDLRKALEQTLGVIKVIDESERLRRIRADVKTDGRPGPIDRTLALHLVEQRPRAITQADRDCAARLPSREETRRVGEAGVRTKIKR